MVSIPFYVLTSSAWSFQFLYILSSLVLFHTFHYSNPSSCEVISHCSKLLLLTSALNWDFLNCWAETWDMWGMSWVLLLDRGTARCEGGWKMKQKHYTGAWVYKDLKTKQRFFRGWRIVFKKRDAMMRIDHLNNKRRHDVGWTGRNEGWELLHCWSSS